MSESLPRGWAIVRLGEHVYLAGRIGWRGLKADEYTPTGPLLLSTYNLNYGDAVDYRDANHISPERYEESPEIVVKEFDILLTKDGAGIGKVGIVSNLPGKATINSSLLLIRAGEGILPAYLFWFLKGPRLQGLARQRITGSTTPHLFQRDIRDFEVAIAPLSEQKRIVAKIEELTARGRRAKEALEAVPPLLDQLRQSVLAAAFRGELTADWRAENPNVEPAVRALKNGQDPVKVRRGVPEKVPLSDVAEAWELPSTWSRCSVAELLHSGALVDVKDGNHGANHPKTAEFGESGLPFVTAAQVSDFQIDYEGAPKLDGPPLKRLRVGFTKSDDAIFTHKGTVGRTAVCDRKCVLTPQTTYYRCRPGGLDPWFVAYFMASSQFIAQYAPVMSQTTRNFVPISGQYEFFFAVPPFPEQLAIVAILAGAIQKLRGVDGSVRSMLGSLTYMNESILAKAFRGELVEQDANDEPALVLLERIRAARDSPKPAGSPAGRRSLLAAGVTEGLDDNEDAVTPIRPESAGATSKDLSDVEDEVLLDEVFAALWTLGPLEKDEAVRLVAGHLRQAGYVQFERLRADGPLFGEVLDAIESAVEAGCLDRPRRGHVRACKADAATYTAADWRHALAVSLGIEPTDREEAIRGAAEWARDNLGLEFVRLRGDGHIVEGLRSAINSAIRRGEVVRHDATHISRGKVAQPAGLNSGAPVKALG